MAESNNLNPWHQIYNNEFMDWQLLNEERTGSPTLYRFTVDELNQNFTLLFPIYHNSIIADDFIKAKKMVNFIKEDYQDSLSQDKLNIVIDIIKSNYKKNDIIDIQKSFNIIKLFIQKCWDLNPIESDICSRQLLSAFGRKLGYCYDSLSKPGLNRSDEYSSEKECDCASDEECDICAEEECDCASDEECDICAQNDSDEEECDCASDEECDICKADCNCGPDEVCEQCAECDCDSDEECDLCASDD